VINENCINDIKKYIAKYPQKESALMPALMLVQKDSGNNLNDELIAEVAELVGVSQSKAYGVATYYSMYNVKKPVGKYHLQVDTNIPATLMGAMKIYQHLEQKLGIKNGETTKDGLFTLSAVECLGSCGSCPVIQVNDTYYENMTIESTDQLIESLKKGILPERSHGYNWATECNVLLKRRGLANSTSIEVYRSTGGYTALAKALTMQPDQIRQEVKNSMLRGRGGAGFPTGVKWGFIPKNNTKPIYLVCNADEGEPGTFKDRQIMEYDPHLLIEGMTISAYALGSKLGFIYIRGEFEWIAQILEKAVEEAKAAGMMQNFDIIVHRGAGAYVCGEETALIESIEGKRGLPRMKPPFPAVEGLYSCPTIVNNVETLASVPFIVENGASEYIKFGPKNNSGFKLYGISGAVNKPGVYECPMGIHFDDLMELAGGIKGNLKAVIVGGLSVPILKKEELSSCSMFKSLEDAKLIQGANKIGLKMDYDSCIKHGTSLGSGGIMVISDEFSIPVLALRTIQFYKHESCGQCTPCRDGSAMIEKILKNMLAGKAKNGDIENILWFCKNINGNTLCPTGAAFSIPIEAMIKKFRNEFEALIK